MQNSNRKAHNRKLLLQDDQNIALLTAKEIADLAKISFCHTYRIVKDSSTHLTGTVRELLTIKALCQIPGWETGWRFDARNQQIITPEGKTLHCTDLENYALTQQILSHYVKLTDFLKKHIKVLEKRLKLPRELRLYVNNSLKQHRVLKMQSRANLKIVNG